MPMFETIQVDLKKKANKSRRTRRNKNRQKQLLSYLKNLQFQNHKTDVAVRTACLQQGRLVLFLRGLSVLDVWPGSAMMGGTWELLKSFPDGHPLIFENVCVNILYIYVYMYMLCIDVEVYGLQIYVYIQIYTYCKVLGKTNDFGNLTVKMKRFYLNQSSWIAISHHPFNFLNLIFTLPRMK